MIIQIGVALLFVTMYLDEMENNKRPGLVSIVDNTYRIIEFRNID